MYRSRATRVVVRLSVVCLAIIAIVQVGLGPVAAAAPAEDGFVPALSEENQGPAPGTGRLIVVTNRHVTDAMRTQLSEYGTVHGLIDRYNLVAITPKGPDARASIQGLPFVRSVETDQLRSLT